MVSRHLLRKVQQLAAVTALSLCAAGSTSAGLFCGCGGMGQTRPYYSPACEPTWGYHQTCWRKFPPLEPCSGWGDYCPTCDTGSGAPMSADGYQNMDGQLMPSSAYADQQFAPPQYSPPQYSNPQYSTPQYSPPQYSTPQYSTPQYSPSPMMIPQPGSNYAAPMNPGSGYPAPANNVPGYPVPMQNAPDSGTPLAPSNLTPIPAVPRPIPQSQDFLPTPDGGPPVPNSTQTLSLPGHYRQTSWSAPGPPVGNVSYSQPIAEQNNQVPPHGSAPTSQPPQPQNLASQTTPRQSFLQNISFRRVRPVTATPETSAAVEAPRPSLFSRLWPGRR